jgi:hypothetical protein
MATLTEEKDAIREILSEYCFHLDGGHFAHMAALFTEDGVWHTAFGKAAGRVEIEALVRKLHAMRPAGARQRGIHMVANLVIKINGDRARVLSNWVVAQNGPAGPVIGSGGGYEDDMVKQDGVWRFQYRRIDRFIAADPNPPQLT